MSKQKEFKYESELYLEAQKEQYNKVIAQLKKQEAKLKDQQEARLKKEEKEKQGNLLTKNYTEFIIPSITIIMSIIKVLFLSAAISSVILPFVVGLLFFGAALAKVQIEKKEAKVVDDFINQDKNSNEQDITKKLEVLNKKYKKYQKLYLFVSTISFLALTVPALIGFLSGGGIGIFIFYFLLDAANVSRLKKYRKEAFDKTHQPLVEALKSPAKEPFELQDNLQPKVIPSEKQENLSQIQTAKTVVAQNRTLIQQIMSPFHSVKKTITPQLLTSRNFRQRTIDKILLNKSPQQNIGRSLV
jgi:hypothetical protein